MDDLVYTHYDGEKYDVVFDRRCICHAQVTAREICRKCDLHDICGSIPDVNALFCMPYVDAEKGSCYLVKQKEVSNEG